MNVPLVDLQAQYAVIKSEVDPAIARVLASCAFAGGPEVLAFEKAFASYCGVKHCIGVSNGTSALEIIIRAFGIGHGHEVIVPANTFFATAEAVSITGAIPVFIDCDERTALIDIEKIEAAITPKTKAIIPVHPYGRMVDAEAIRTIADRHKIAVIEDCAQSHGAALRGKKAGSIGLAAGFSYYPGKNLGAYGEAGAITTNDDTIADFCRTFRDHGSKTKYEHRIVGRNDRMDGIQGAVLGVKLKYIDRWNELRRMREKQFRELLKDEPRARFLDLPAESHEHVHHLLVIRVPDRDRVRKALNDKGIGAGIHYPIPLHLQEVYQNLGYNPGSFPISERLAGEILSLPLYPEMTEQHVEHVVKSLKDIL